MAEHACCQARDWVGDFRSYALAWGLPTVALVVTVFVSPPVRTLIWPILHSLSRQRASLRPYALLSLRPLLPRHGHGRPLVWRWASAPRPARLDVARRDDRRG
jgi:hypothetical protein